MERKFRLPAPALLQGRVAELGGSVLGEVRFTDSYFDTPDCKLTRQDVRRVAEWKSVESSCSLGLSLYHTIKSVLSKLKHHPERVRRGSVHSRREGGPAGVRAYRDSASPAGVASPAGRRLGVQDPRRGRGAQRGRAHGHGEREGARRYCSVRR